MEVGCGGGWEARRPQIPLIWLDTPARLSSPDLVSGVHPGLHAWTHTSTCRVRQRQRLIHFDLKIWHGGENDPL